jgi:frataxin-like iron-binding protein CyaY
MVNEIFIRKKDQSWHKIVLPFSELDARIDIEFSDAVVNINTFIVINAMSRDVKNKADNDSMWRVL